MLPPFSPNFTVPHPFLNIFYSRLLSRPFSSPLCWRSSLILFLEKERKSYDPFSELHLYSCPWKNLAVAFKRKKYENLKWFRKVNLCLMCNVSKAIDLLNMFLDFEITYLFPHLPFFEAWNKNTIEIPHIALNFWPCYAKPKINLPWPRSLQLKNAWKDYQLIVWFNKKNIENILWVRVN